jgi:hypothetical protein
MNNLQDFINEALCQPSDYLSYFVSRKLSEMYPDAALIEGDSNAFNLSEYASENQCSFVRMLDVHEQQITFWRGHDEEILKEIENGWYTVMWPDEDREHLFDVLFLTFYEGGGRTRRYWIVSEMRALGERFLKAVCDWCDDVRGEILIYEDGYWRKDKALADGISSATFDNLILPATLVSELRGDLQRFFSSREVYERYGIPWKRGVLLIGPPGNGKTHTIKALVNELQLPCLYVKSLRGGFSSDQSNLRRVFERARQMAPCLIVLEDLDSQVDEDSRSFLLNEMDGFAVNTGILVVATTNHPERLDPALLERPSRFDRKYFFGLPEFAERERYIALWNDSLQPELKLKGREVRYVAARTAEFSFAYLKELFVSAMMQWMEGQQPGTMGRIMRERLEMLARQMQSAPLMLEANAPQPLESLHETSPGQVLLPSGERIRGRILEV